ncbi:phenylalanyl-tRNA synthetase, alpha subunit [Melghirimyces thermohalophilus]|uniref:Phenylalanine--tRNA ligase alpha subunit n=1 Tax=Melghirimyces thermohalophilus TaxID=1236220 RepID=A0A1G6MRV2_9BACL|nr:phenylalanine--tRNA ligase subunit alpha [Melghirimyces thermohalophilus]SDC57937.1 phenylalanyl-tRNA synthetase, alpha subunit [Melghirimyces thermohalophilus]
MREKLEKLKQAAEEQIDAASSPEQLKEIRVKYLGKKGEITSILRGMKDLSPEERPVIGSLANQVRGQLEEWIQEKEESLQEALLEARLQEESIDVTLPGRPEPLGTVHPLNGVIEQIEDIFIGMGFEVAEGPEVETDYYNFEALNLPKDHPARDMQDSFYITPELLLRTQTSPVQVRSMESKEGKVPVKIICPGKVYRRDDDDATHTHQFTQVEGLVVDRGIAMSELHGTLLTFAEQIFGEKLKSRLRPSYFPFTEPSVEMDISCVQCGGSGCRMCKQTGWIEILGAGMVHPRVLERGGYDSERYTGFAFGMGPERIAMMKYGIDDIRHFYTNDLRFLRQFQSI